MFVEVDAPGLMSSTSTQGKPRSIPHDEKLFNEWAVNALTAMRAEQITARWADEANAREAIE